MTRTPSTVAKAALMEAGRPDLAQRVVTDAGGWPNMRHTHEENPAVIRAFWLAHLSVGHLATLTPNGHGHRGVQIHCRDCGWPRHPIIEP